MNQQKLKPLPRHLEYEKNLIGCCIRDPYLIGKYNIKATLFYEERDMVIFLAILKMLAKRLTIGDLEIFQFLNSVGWVDEVRQYCPSGLVFTYLGNLVDNSIMGNTTNQVKKLRDLAQKRRLWRQAYRLMKEIEREAANDF